MQPDAARTDMEPKPKRQTPFLLLVLLGFWVFSALPPVLPSSWHLSVQVAQVRVTFAKDAAPVRNRTPLVGIGQLLARLGLAS
jgi:hypothetical protein